MRFLSIPLKIHNWHCTKDMHFLSYNSIICCNNLMSVLEVRQKCHNYNRRLSKSKETAALNSQISEDRDTTDYFLLYRNLQKQLQQQNPY